MISFDELMNIRRYLTSASTRLTALSIECGLYNFDTWWSNNQAWNIVKAYMDEHPELT